MIVAKLEQEDHVTETTDALAIDPEPRSLAETSSRFKEPWVACPERCIPGEAPSAIGLHPWLKRLFFALALAAAGNCAFGLGVAGYELLAALLYWVFIGVLTVTTIITVYLAK